VHVKFPIGLAAIVLAAAPLFAAAPSDFNLSTPSRIPGTTLDPGSYTIRILSRLSDRIILRIDGKDGTVRSTFIGIPNNQIAKPASTGPVRWSTSPAGPAYLKGWYFPGMSSVVEFVYPKAEALAIASSNPAKVPAIDPASEGKVADNTLSQDDMQLLTLWLLSVGQVQSGDQAPVVKAERYQIASLHTQKPVINALPHTAGRLPLIWLLGFCSILAAASLRILQWRRRTLSLPRRSAVGSSHVTPRTL
jgi:hypothetical protein